MKQVKCKSGLTGWQCRLQKNYDNSFEQFEAYNETYAIATRLGYKNAEEAWKANPIIQGSTEPSDLRVVLDENNKVDFVKEEVQEVFKKFMNKKIELPQLLSKLKAIDNRLKKQFAGKDKSIWFRLFKGDTGATTIRDIEATLKRERGFANCGYMLDSMEIGLNIGMEVYYS